MIRLIVLSLAYGFAFSLQVCGEEKYAEWCQQNDWIFVHPNFRCPNRTPEALGSDLNHGITDGRSGSVPFSHSLQAFNSLVPASARIPEAFIAVWYTDPATLPRDPNLGDAHYGTNPPLLRETHGNTRVTIFEGGHEILHEAALNWLAAQRKEQPANWNPAKTATLKSTATDRESGK
jgi:hypothetical protein